MNFNFVRLPGTSCLVLEMCKIPLHHHYEVDDKQSARGHDRKFKVAQCSQQKDLSSAQVIRLSAAVLHEQLMAWAVPCKAGQVEIKQWELLAFDK